ncbi:MAG: PQQ-binding-like beta-propeller repeat protein [Flavipsychrobacter sp.]|nr:PQQ-binding-like beta-propeller repeat protein [Flavipsychrobacter sp.]
MRLLDFSICSILFYLIAFQTDLRAQEKARFAFLTDLHVSPGTASEAGLAAIVDDINRDSVDFVVVTGDITNTGSNAELESVHRLLSQLKPTYYILPGNHETNWSETAGKRYLELWKQDRFHFSYKKFYFIGFNTGPYMKMGDGHVKQEDLIWLDNTLKREVQPGQVVVSLAHYPLGDGLDNWYDVTNILKKYHTKLALCGHGHRLSIHNFDGITGIMGRSSLPKGTPGVGYNLIELSIDSVRITEKLSGQPGEKLHYAMDLSSNAALQKKINGLPASYNVNDSFAAFKPVYQYQDKSSVFTAAVPTGRDKIVFGCSDGTIKLLDRKKNKLIWKQQLPGSVYSTPVVYDEKIIIGSIDGKLHAFSLKDGKEQWVQSLAEPIISEVTVKNGLLYIGAGNGTMYCLSAQDGVIKWKFDGIQGQIQTRATISGNHLVVGAWDKFLYCLDAITGKLKWKWTNGSPQKLYSPGNVIPVIADSKVFIVAPDRYMTAIELETGKTLWRSNRHRVRESMGGNPANHSVYAKLMNDTIISVSTHADFIQTNWATHAGFGYEHNPCPITVSKGILYAGTKNGMIIALEEKTGKLLWKYKLGNSSINGIRPDIKGGIWVSLIEGSIAYFNYNHTSKSKTSRHGKN